MHSDRRRSTMHSALNGAEETKEATRRVSMARTKVSPPFAEKLAGFDSFLAREPRDRLSGIPFSRPPPSPSAPLDLAVSSLYWRANSSLDVTRRAKERIFFRRIFLPSFNLHPPSSRSVVSAGTASRNDRARRFADRLINFVRAAPRGFFSRAPRRAG